MRYCRNETDCILYARAGAYIYCPQKDSVCMAQPQLSTNANHRPGLFFLIGMQVCMYSYGPEVTYFPD